MQICHRHTHNALLISYFRQYPILSFSDHTFPSLSSTSTTLPFLFPPTYSIEVHFLPHHFRHTKYRVAKLHRRNSCDSCNLRNLTDKIASASYLVRSIPSTSRYFLHYYGYCITSEVPIPSHNIYNNSVLFSKLVFL